jgi:hypothetical protein
MKSACWIGIVGGLAALSAAASAEPLTLRERIASQEAQLIRDARTMNKACGTAVEVKFDWTAVKEGDLANYSAEGYCDAALEGIRQVCGDPAGREAVKEKIKSLTCGFGTSREIALKDGAVDYKINFNSTNDSAFVYEALENAL